MSSVGLFVLIMKANKVCEAVMQLFSTSFGPVSPYPLSRFLTATHQIPFRLIVNLEHCCL